LGGGGDDDGDVGGAGRGDRLLDQLVRAGQRLDVVEREADEGEVAEGHAVGVVGEGDLDRLARGEVDGYRLLRRLAQRGSRVLALVDELAVEGGLAADGEDEPADAGDGEGVPAGGVRGEGAGGGHRLHRAGLHAGGQLAHPPGGAVGEGVGGQLGAARAAEDRGERAAQRRQRVPR